MPEKLLKGELQRVFGHFLIILKFGTRNSRQMQEMPVLSYFSGKFIVTIHEKQKQETLCVTTRDS